MENFNLNLSVVLVLFFLKKYFIHRRVILTVKWDSQYLLNRGSCVPNVCILIFANDII